MPDPHKKEPTRDDAVSLEPLAPEEALRALLSVKADAKPLARRRDVGAIRSPDEGPDKD